MHLKRFKAPNFWPIETKKDTWTYSTSPGPHTHSNSFPLGLILRDILKISASSHESKLLLQDSSVKVNGKIRKSIQHPIGLMDVLEVGGGSYLVAPSGSGLVLKEVKSQKFYLAKIIAKTQLPKGKIQYTIHNGNSFLAENKYKVGDTLKLDFKGKVVDHFPPSEGSHAIVTGGRLQGMSGKIKKLGERTTLETPDGDVETIKAYIFVTGSTKPEVELLTQQPSNKSEVEC